MARKELSKDDLDQALKTLEWFLCRRPMELADRLFPAWIHISDKLPPPHTAVLAIMSPHRRAEGGHSVNEPEVRCVAAYHPERQSEHQWYRFDGGFHVRVTHWMHLPSLP